MKNKLSNQGADGIRRVGFYSDGDIVPVYLYIKDGRIHSHQMNCDIVETQKTYRGNCEYVTEFLGRPVASDSGYLVTPACETKALMAVELLPLLKDSFDFMEPRSAELHSKITDLSNYILDWAVSQYDPEVMRDIEELEYVLQPFWDDGRAIDIEDVPPLDLDSGDFKYHPNAFVIHQRKDGYYHIADWRHSSHFEDYLVPNDSVDDVWLIQYDDDARSLHVHDFKVTRIKG